MRVHKFKTRRLVQPHSANGGAAVSSWPIEQWSIAETDQWYELHQMPQIEDGKIKICEATEQVASLIERLMKKHLEVYPDAPYNFGHTTIVIHEDSDLSLALGIT